MSDNPVPQPQSESTSTEVSSADKQLSPPTPQSSIPEPVPNPPVYEIRLPEALPTRWLDDIKRAISESRKALIISTILGSSLLTGLLTTLANYSLEGRKTILQLEMEDGKDSLHQFNDLRNAIYDFKYALNLSASVFKTASGQPSNAALTSIVNVQIESLEDRAAVLKKSVAKVDDQDTYNLIEKALTPLTPALSEVKFGPPDQKKLQNLTVLCEKTRDEDVKNILEHIKRRKQEIISSF